MREFYTGYGETKSLYDWYKDKRNPYKSMYYLRTMILKKGVEKAFDTYRANQGGRTPKLYEAFGEKKTIKDWIKDPRCKMDKLGSLRNRVYKYASLKLPFEVMLLNHEDFKVFLNRHKVTSNLIKKAVKIIKNYNDTQWKGILTDTEEQK